MFEGLRDYKKGLLTTALGDWWTHSPGVCSVGNTVAKHFGTERKLTFVTGQVQVEHSPFTVSKCFCPTEHNPAVCVPEA
jgi:hypothetical protein